MLLEVDFARGLGAEQLAADQSEQRMTRRLTNYWTALRDNNPYPARSAIRVEAVQGLCEYGICIALNKDGPGPIYQMVGTKLKEMAGIDLSGKLVIDTPDDTLLAVAGKHCTEVLQNKGPVTLESEFSDNEGTVFLFRMIMLPCSEDGQHIDSVIGAITFKEKPSIKEKLAQTTSPAAPETISVAAPQAALPIVAERKQSAGQTIDTRHPTAASNDDLTKSLREGQGLALAGQSHEHRSRTPLYETRERACVPKKQSNLTPRIVVVGLGGAGGNAVDNMIRTNLEGVEFVVANTDTQALEQSQCERRVLLGQGVTRGLGAGSRPDVGRAATEEALDEVLAVAEGANMVFITAGMGGGTGTGGAPVIARAAREAGILTVGVVTKPFHFEGIRRMRLAEAGIIELGKQADTLIVIPNQNLFRVADEKTTFADAFRIADEVLHSGVRGVTDLMVMPGLINLDFADVQSVMAEMGKAIMGAGESEGENRALEAAEAAISNPLLDDISMKGARGVLVNIAGGMDLTLFEVDQAANRIREEVDNEANIIFGSVFDQRLEGRMRVSVVATGIDAEAAAQGTQPHSVPLSLIVSRDTDQAAAPEPAPEPAAPAASVEPETAIEPAPEPIPNIGAEPAPLPSTGSAGNQSDTAADGAANDAASGDARMEPAAQVSGAAIKAIRDEVVEWPAQAAPNEDSTVVEIATPAQPPAQASAQQPPTQTKPSFEPAPKFAPAGAALSEAAQAETASVPVAGPRTDFTDESEPGPKKRRPGGLFSWMAGRGSAGADENFEKGDRHYYGQGVRKNLALALRAYRKAAEQGHAAAQNRLGWMFEKGEGTEADYAEAVTWYERAAEQGHINAMNDLGYMHRQGWGVTQSYPEALRWFRRAAEKYDSYAEYNMGQMYENGWGVGKDQDEAIRWFRRSAARGHEWAAKRLEELGVRT